MIVAGVLLVFIALWFGLQAYEHRLIYPGSKRLQVIPDDFRREVEEVEFCAEDGISLHGRWFSHAEARGVFLVCHGNAGNVSDRLWIAEDLQDLPVNIFIFDYRGYGKSKGIASEKGTGLDVAAAWEYARNRCGGGESPPILIYGRSLGGAVALQAATVFPVRGVILESTFTSILEIAARRYPWLLPRLTCRNPYRSDLRISRVLAPVLMAHSPDDQVIPFELGEALYRKVPNPRKFIRLSGNHVEAGWQTSPEYAAAVREFVSECIPAGKMSAEKISRIGREKAV
ncbi:MAG: alpha/beta hydrolase [Kiritimatiellia bacterium]